MPDKKTLRSPTRILKRDEHILSRKNISQLALNILYRLKEAGFQAYLVGGGVRDLLLDLHPKDFDVATNAHPDQIRKLFHNSRIIGRRFQIVHVFSNKQLVEVTTFRGTSSHSTDATLHSQNEHGIILCDNLFGSIEEDAVRRDFTVNALYYNIDDYGIVDFVNGIEDLKNKTMRIIGDPETRFREDPMRMLRAIRLASKLNFTLEKNTAQAIPKMREMLKHVSHARLFDEFIKILKSGKATATFENLIAYDLLIELFPSLPPLWENNPEAEALAKKALANGDTRIKENKSINPAFMLSVLYWPILLQQLALESTFKHSPAAAFEKAMQHACRIALHDLSIPKRLIAQMRDIWFLQHRFNMRSNKRLLNIPDLPKFRAAYDFLLLRAELNQKLKPLSEWWTNFYESDIEQRQHLLKKKPVIAI